LDSKKEINLFGLIFIDTVGSVLLAKESFYKLTILQRMNVIDAVVKILDRVGDKGYLNSCDLRIFPIINTFLPAFINNDVEESLRMDYINGNKSMESYK